MARCRARRRAYAESDPERGVTGEVLVPTCKHHGMANIPQNTYVEENAGGPGIMGVEDAVKGYSIFLSAKQTYIS